MAVGAVQCSAVQCSSGRSDTLPPSSALLLSGPFALHGTAVTQSTRLGKGGSAVMHYIGLGKGGSGAVQCNAEQCNTDVP
eukprot:1159691-Pelagomonas_calceolata.AAC.2